MPALRAVPLQGAGRTFLGGSCLSVFPALVPYSTFIARGGRPGPRALLPGPGSLAPMGMGPCNRGSLAPGGL